MTDVGPNDSPYYERYYQRFGDRIVANWKKHPNGSTQQDCFMYTYEKAQTAMQQLGGARFPHYNPRYALCALWGNHINIGKEKWLSLPSAWRGRGAPGALMYEGRGTRIYEGPEIFQGVLEPGAVLQGWKKFHDYINVYNGDPVSLDKEGKPNPGHSFFFREYKRDKNGMIIGFYVIDAGYYVQRPVPYRSSGRLGVLVRDEPALRRRPVHRADAVAPGRDAPARTRVGARVLTQRRL